MARLRVCGEFRLFFLRLVDVVLGVEGINFMEKRL